MPARSAIPGLKRIPRGGRVVWWWVASQLSRHTKGFRPRTVRLWSTAAEPTQAELRLIEAECQQLSGALKEWLATGKLKKLRARFQIGTIYFAKAGERVKIGFSADPIRRQSDIQVSCADKVSLLGTLPGTQAIERHIQHRFRSLRVRGEWFRLEQRLLDFIADETAARTD